MDVVKDLLLVNVRNIVMLGQLSGIERLARARSTRDGDLEWLEASLLAKLLLDALNVGSQSTLAVPLEAAFVFLGRCLFPFLSTFFLRDEDLRWSSLDV